ncbi:peptidoglycan editing factor PgeF [Rickettsiales endosymbiont of Peranema trichophorum]|uniref:peptidoglycan editing factor PgeF n=1 Tax=Rickettsiales endosymbiont of Peranema trichophorum TaxID=2486577 RepID=UPI001022DC90|nr:peptidoglycan editing factor PgeF [Rickettsiales endosymbiont of Peranema trichophorum]RZI47358.1 peptidoglycan editing factor PgeF [Rickettsiales endosymbiont of Peranema trichophorum]
MPDYDSDSQYDLFRYYSQVLAELSGIEHCFFGKPKHVTDEYELTPQTYLSSSFSMSAKNVIMLRQVHSTNVVTILNQSSADIGTEEADAIVSNVPGLLLCVRTGDCAPVLFYDAYAKVIGVAHAGWKGAINGILTNTIYAMEKIGAQRTNTVCAVGPCIQQASYEVDQTFYEEFISRNPAHEQFFTNSLAKPNHYMFDLPNFCTTQLLCVNVKNVDNLGVDTYTNVEQLHSFRRATHQMLNDKAKALRQFSCIRLRHE